jgi:hypothetical protein
MAFRERTNGSIDDYVTPNNRFECDESSSGGTYTLSQWPVGESRYIYDAVTPGFKTRSRKGEVFVNIMHSVHKQKTANFGEWRRDIATCPGSPKRQYANTPYAHSTGMTHDDLWAKIPTVSLDNLLRLAGTEALANVAEPTVMGLLELAEFNKTAKLVDRPVTQLKYEVEQAKRRKNRGRFSRLKTVGEFISSNWLKYRYGITPLVLTANELVKLATEVKKGPRITARGSTTDSASDSGTSAASAYFWDVDFDWYASLDVHVRAGVLYEQQFTTLQRAGLYVSDIPAVAWELIPYSFVADWLVNTGDVISALTPKSNVRELARWTTVQQVSVATFTYQGSWNNISGWVNTSAPSGSYTIKEVSKDRIPGTEVGLATKTHEITFERSIDWIHAADTLALITNILRNF